MNKTVRYLLINNALSARAGPAFTEVPKKARCVTYLAFVTCDI